MQRWAETICIPLVSSEAQINKNCSACQQETEITAGSRAVPRGSPCTEMASRADVWSPGDRKQVGPHRNDSDPGLGFAYPG